MHKDARASSIYIYEQNVSFFRAGVEFCTEHTLKHCNGNVLPAKVIQKRDPLLSL